MIKRVRQYNHARSRLNKYVKAHGMRPSRVRNTVLEMAFNLHQPFTAEQLIEVCAIERISAGTVYNALKIFVEAEIISGQQRQRGHLLTEYEIISESPRHMQLICTKCGRVTDLTLKPIARDIEEHKYTNFQLHHYSLILYGECKTCRKKQ